MFAQGLECKSFESRSRTDFILRTYDNSAGDKGELGHNTDAFDVGSSENIWISGAIVHNQESVTFPPYRFSSPISWNITKPPRDPWQVTDTYSDCLAINSGTNITFTGGSCTGGHGLSM